MWEKHYSNSAQWPLRCGQPDCLTFLCPPARAHLLTLVLSILQNPVANLTSRGSAPALSREQMVSLSSKTSEPSERHRRKQKTAGGGF